MKAFGLISMPRYLISMPKHSKTRGLSKSEMEKENNLAIWLDEQMEQYNNGTLEKWKCDKLRELMREFPDIQL